MLKDEFCTRGGSRCVILRGAVAALPGFNDAFCFSFHAGTASPGFNAAYGCWLDSVVRYTDDFLQTILDDF